MTSPFVGFENQVNMTPAVTAPAQATEVKQAAAVLPATPADSVELSSKEPKQLIFSFSYPFSFRIRFIITWIQTEWYSNFAKIT